MPGTPSIEHLTPREREILALIAEGNSLVEIAQKLSRSQKTIESHRLSLGRKLNASNRVELAKIAIANGLISLGGEVAEPGVLRTLADQDLALLEKINDAIFNASGSVLLERFCVAASTLPGVDYAIVCTPDRALPNPDPLKRVVMAIAHKGVLGSPMRYDAAKTAFTRVAEEGECCITSGLVDAFPEDPWTREIGAESYLGMQLVEESGKTVGGIGLIGLKPMENAEILRRAIGFFAPRLVGALRTSFELDALRAQVDLLESEMTEVSPGAISKITGTELTPGVSDALSQVLRRVQALAGASFLRGIVDAMVETFGLSHAGICLHERGQMTQTLRSVLFSIDGEISEDIVYELNHTPCQLTLEKGHYFIRHGAAEEFPKDALLTKAGIDGYVGVRLPGPAGQIIGLLWLGSRDEIMDPNTMVFVAKHFAPRIGAELHNYLRFEALLQEHERLERQLKKQAGP